MTAPGRVAGLGLLVMSVLAGFANFGVVEKIQTPADTTTTLFRAAVLALVLVVALDVVVALALREFFAPVDHALATLAACFRYAVDGGLVKGGNASTPKDRHSLTGATRP